MSINDDLPPLPAARFPQMYYCNKCGKFPLSSEHEGCNYMAVTDGMGRKFSAEQMQAYAREAVAAEREACAKACESEAAKWELDGEPCAPMRLCSAAIRARDEQ